MAARQLHFAIQHFAKAAAVVDSRQRIPRRCIDRLTVHERIAERLKQARDQGLDGLLLRRRQRARREHPEMTQESLLEHQRVVDAIRPGVAGGHVDAGLLVGILQATVADQGGKVLAENSNQGFGIEGSLQRGRELQKILTVDVRRRGHGLQGTL